MQKISEIKDGLSTPMLMGHPVLLAEVLCVARYFFLK